MKRIKSILLALLMLSTLFITPALAYDSSSALDLSIKDGVFSANSAQPLQASIDNYFSMRERNSEVRTQNITVAPDTLVNEIEDRSTSLYDFWLKRGFYIFDYENSTQIIDAHAQSSGNVSVNVYEWTWLDYSSDENASASEISRMGFATIHDMLVSPSLGYQVVSDSYDERDITGFASNDFLSNVTSAIDETVYLENTDSTDYGISPQAVNSSKMPNPSACFNYANKYVIHSIASSAGTSYSQYYNTAVYGYESGNDCCNYVSQCLYAGGFSMDPTSGGSTSSSSQWWHGRNGNLYNSSYSWRTVSGFISYWKPRFGLVNASLTTVSPGNAVLTSDKGHIAICVGYNEKNQPIINGHTRDVWHQPLVIGDYPYMIPFNCSHSLTYKKYSDRYHQARCSKCEQVISTSAHNFKLSGAYYTCTLCGYQTTKIPETSSIVNPSF